MEITIYSDFGFLSCILRKSHPQGAFICDCNNMSMGVIRFDTFKLKFDSINEGRKTYELIKR